MAVGALAISPDGNLLAYSTDPTGFRQYTLHIRDLRTGDRPARHRRARRLRRLGRRLAHPLLLHRRRDHQAPGPHLPPHPRRARTEDALVLHEPDERFNLGIGSTRDGQYLMIEAGSHTTNEYRFLSAANPTGEFQPPRPARRRPGVLPRPSHRGPATLLHPHQRRRQELPRRHRPPATPGREHWTELIPLDPDHPLEDFDLFQSFAVATRRKLGLPTLEVLRFANTAGCPIRHRLHRDEGSASPRH